MITPRAYSHTSVAIRDALMACDDAAIIELQLSDIHKREGFRHHSHVSPVATGVMLGFAAYGYELAFQAISKLVEE
ncbi:MAG: type II 3-dehydroquinate dehydratase [Gemmatimonadales bacterium]